MIDRPDRPVGPLFSGMMRRSMCDQTHTQAQATSHVRAVGFLTLVCFSCHLPTRRVDRSIRSAGRPSLLSSCVSCRLPPSPSTDSAERRRCTPATVRWTAPKRQRTASGQAASTATVHGLNRSDADDVCFVTSESHKKPPRGTYTTNVKNSWDGAYGTAQRHFRR